MLVEQCKKKKKKKICGYRKLRMTTVHVLELNYAPIVYHQEAPLPFKLLQARTGEGRGGPKYYWGPHASLPIWLE